MSCPEELQVLQTMEEKNREEGVVLLAVSLDSPETRPKIPDFLQKHGIHARVLLGDEQRLQEYGARVAGATYLIDRNGILAALPGEFYLRLKERMEVRLTELLEGKPARGPLLWGVEKAPPGFGILWKQETGRAVKALAVAPPSKKSGAEIALLDEEHLRRYSASGQLQGEAPVEAERFYDLQGADLDGDGKNEWIAAGQEGFTLLDGAGEVYWQYPFMGKSSRVVGTADLDGDGFLEILVQDGSTLAARRAVPGFLWKTPPLGTIRSAILDPRGAIVVQTEDGIQAFDPSGRPQGPRSPAPGGAVLKGRLDRGDGRFFDVFGRRYNAWMDSAHDLDGDGKKDVVISGGGGIAAYSQDGSPFLILRIDNSQDWPHVALENLDGRPGDELIVTIPDYGLVAMGISPEAKPFDGGSVPTASVVPSAAKASQQVTGVPGKSD